MYYLYTSHAISPLAGATEQKMRVLILLIINPQNHRFWGFICVMVINIIFKKEKPMLIRHETPADIDAIEKLIYQAFLNHPHHAEGAKPTEHLIVAGLRDGGVLTLSQVAEMDGEVVGHIAISPITINSENKNWYGLAPVSVTPNMQGKGIGTALIKNAMQMMQDKGVEGMVLLGEPEYYTRFGFKADNRLTLDGVPPEYFMCHSFTGNIPSGTVQYHPAFV